MRYKFECWTWLLCAKCKRQYRLAGGSILAYIVREAGEVKFKCRACGSNTNVIRLHLYCPRCKVTRKCCGP